MQIVDSAKLPLSAISYAEDVKKGINSFLSHYADTLSRNLRNSQSVTDLQVKYAKNYILLSFYILILFHTIASTRLYEYYDAF